VENVLGHSPPLQGGGYAEANPSGEFELGRLPDVYTLIDLPKRPLLHPCATIVRWSAAP
jgi:hypothetical protein